MGGRTWQRFVLGKNCWDPGATRSLPIPAMPFPEDLAGQKALLRILPTVAEGDCRYDALYQAAPLSCDHLLGQDHEEFKRRLLDFSLAHEQDPCPVNPDFPEHRELLRSFGVTTLGQHIELLTPEYESVTVWRDAVRADRAWGDAAVFACAALFLHARIDVLVRNSVEQWSLKCRDESRSCFIKP